MENKKLTKILYFSGLGLLFAFIMVRVITYHKTDQLSEMPQIGEVKVEDSKLPEEKTKNQIIDELSAEKKKKENLGDGNQYVQPIDLRTFTTENKQESSSATIRYQTNPNTNTRPATSSGTIANNRYSKTGEYSSGQLNYKSDFFDKQKQVQPTAAVVLTQTPQQATTANKNPFGTIKSGGPTPTGQSENTKDYYSAQVYGDQKLMANTALIVRNMEDITFNNMVIQKNSLFYGVVTFSGNRVMVHINKVRTSQGEFPVNYTIMDNDRIEGLYYQAPIDEVVAGTTDQANLNSNVSSNSVYGTAINNLSKGAVNGTKQLIQKSRSLTLTEGYPLYLLPGKISKS